MIWLTLIIQIAIGIIITIIFILSLEFIATILIDAGKLKAGIFLSTLTNLLTKKGYIILGEGYYFKGEFSTAADFLLFAAQTDILYRPVALYYLAKCNSCLEEVFDYASALILPHEFSTTISETHKTSEQMLLNERNKNLDKYITLSKDDLSQGRLHMAMALTYYNKGIQDQKALELAQTAVRYVSNIKSFSKISLMLDYADMLLYYEHLDDAQDQLETVETLIKDLNLYQKILTGFSHLSNYNLLQGKIFKTYGQQKRATEYFIKAIKLSNESFYATEAKQLLKG